LYKKSSRKWLDFFIGSNLVWGAKVQIPAT
jgi:hypothetical protein